MRALKNGSDVGSRRVGWDFLGAPLQSYDDSVSPIRNRPISTGIFVIRPLSPSKTSEPLDARVEQRARAEGQPVRGEEPLCGGAARSPGEAGTSELRPEPGDGSVERVPGALAAPSGGRGRLRGERPRLASRRVSRGGGNSPARFGVALVMGQPLGVLVAFTAGLFSFLSPACCHCFRRTSPSSPACRRPI